MNYLLILAGIVVYMFIGQRCRQTGGMPCHPHKGREVVK